MHVKRKREDGVVPQKLLEARVLRNDAVWGCPNTKAIPRLAKKRIIAMHRLTCIPPFGVVPHAGAAWT